MTSMTTRISSPICTVVKSPWWALGRCKTLNQNFRDRLWEVGSSICHVVHFLTLWHFLRQRAICWRRPLMKQRNLNVAQGLNLALGWLGNAFPLLSECAAVMLTAQLQTDCYAKVSARPELLRDLNDITKWNCVFLPEPAISLLPITPSKIGLHWDQLYCKTSGTCMEDWNCREDDDMSGRHNSGWRRDREER